MRKPALAGLLLSGFIFTTASQPVGAQALDYLQIENTASYIVEGAVFEAIKPKLEAKKTKPKRVIHRVKSGETLNKIAKEHKTSWKRIYYKNRKLKNPDVIKVNQKLVIPAASEKLKKRKLPVSRTAAARQSSSSNGQRHTVYQPRGSSAGNGYNRGYCTWYAKSRRLDLPNNLGNANTWVSRARAQGLPTGTTPRVGAVGQQGMHVVYVEIVHSNGTVTVSEMNWNGWNVVNRRRVPANSFLYIY